MKIHSRARFIIYGLALALAIAATVFFGWAGFWLGVALVLLAMVGVWAVPLIKLSYRRDRPRGTDAH